jgi:predicted nucleotidyltransferase component of viral defense system
MSSHEDASIRVHEDRELFREAVNYTAAETGFGARLIEKDYYCTVVLAYVNAAQEAPLVFKGGTCLAKVHTGFYRLSEDLDFVIPMAVGASRAARRQRAARVKEMMAALPGRVACFDELEPFSGANNSTQYLGSIGYRSVLGSQVETIKIEVSLREPLWLQAEKYPARTVLMNPLSGGPMVPASMVRCIARTEAMAEKFRAALTRRAAAIRDFYDIDHAVQHHLLSLQDTELIELIGRKLAIPGNGPVSIGSERLEQLRGQLSSRLKPVLRAADYESFSLDRAFSLVLSAAKMLDLPD